MKRSRSIDWADIARQYVTSDLTLRQVAEANGLSMSPVAKHSRRDNWVSKREAYREDTAQKVQAFAQLQTLERFTTLYEVSDKLDSLLAKFANLYEDADRKAGNNMPCREMAELSKAFQNAIAAKRDLYDIPTSAEREKNAVARERLRMDAERVKALKEAASKETEAITVELEGELEDLAK